MAELEVNQRQAGDVTILDMSGAVRIGDRDVVERLDRRRHRIGADGVVGLADLRIAARQGQVLRVDRIHNL